MEKSKFFFEKATLQDFVWGLFYTSGIPELIEKIVRKAMVENIHTVPEPRKSNDDSAYFTRSEVCQLAHITETTLWRLEKAGVIKKIKLGRKNLYSRLEVEALLGSGGFCVPPKCDKKESKKVGRK